MRILYATILLFTALPISVLAQNKHSLNFCPLGVPVYNLYAVNYEYIVNRKHGFNLRIDYAPLSSSNIDITDKAVILNYRRYLNENRHSLFAGVYTRYRQNSGSGNVANSEFDFDSTEKTVGLNAGKRWIWRNGLSVVALMGYGISEYDETKTHSDNDIDAKLGRFKNDNDLFFDNPFYGEISVGYAF